MKIVKLGNMVIREARRDIDRDRDMGHITIRFEPVYGTVVTKKVQSHTQHFIVQAEKNLDEAHWIKLKDISRDDLSQMIYNEVKKGLAVIEDDEAIDKLCTQTSLMGFLGPFLHRVGYLKNFAAADISHDYTKDELSIIEA